MGSAGLTVAWGLAFVGLVLLNAVALFGFGYVVDIGFVDCFGGWLVAFCLVFDLLWVAEVGSGVVAVLVVIIAFVFVVLGCVLVDFGLCLRGLICFVSVFYDNGVTLGGLLLYVAVEFWDVLVIGGFWCFGGIVVANA